MGLLFSGGLNVFLTVAFPALRLYHASLFKSFRFLHFFSARYGYSYSTLVKGSSAWDYSFIGVQWILLTVLFRYNCEYLGSDDMKEILCIEACMTSF